MGVWGEERELLMINANQVVFYSWEGLNGAGDRRILALKYFGLMAYEAS
jgi:hypothetical protein